MYKYLLSVDPFNSFIHTLNIEDGKHRPKDLLFDTDRNKQIKVFDNSKAVFNIYPKL